MCFIVQVTTYDVVPLSPALGMLAFVGGTQPLLSVMSPTLLDANGPASDAFWTTIRVRSPREKH